MRKINKIILHCTATAEGKEYSVDTIRKWHLKRGFSDIGYHYLIGLDGTIHLGRDVFKQGAHTLGENKTSIGVAYVGGVESVRVGGKWKPKDTMTQGQETGFLVLYNSLKIVFGDLALHGHSEYANKACPSFIVKDKYKYLVDTNNK